MAKLGGRSGLVLSSGFMRVALFANASSKFSGQGTYIVFPSIVCLSGEKKSMILKSLYHHYIVCQTVV